MTKQQVFQRALWLNLFGAIAIAVLGAGIGYLTVGLPGLAGGLLGAGLALGFGLLTLLSVRIGGTLPLGGFYAMVLGGWLVKVLLFAILIGSLRNAEWLNGPTFFFALVAAVLGNLALDSWVVLKGRIETVQS